MPKESLQLTQDQKQVLTTSALQVAFSSLLEMNSQELDDRINREIEDNPALEKAPDSDNEHPDNDDSPIDDDSDFDDSASDSDSTLHDDGPDYDDYSDRDESVSDGYLPRANNRSPDDDVFVPVIADNDQTLAEYLTAQLAEFDLTDRQREIAHTIIGNINDDGYLTRSASAMANDLGFQTGDYYDDGEVREVMDMIRQMDPAGVCATSLGDCLLLQLQRLSPVTEDIADAMNILDISDDLASVNKMNTVRSQLGLSKNRFDDALRRIKSLNPKPGGMVGSNSVAYASQIITPDFEVLVDDNDTITITLLNAIPELQISESFSEETERTQYSGDSMSAREARKFIANGRYNAKSFIRILQMRQSTLFNVMSAIVKIQREFFLTGDEREIRPMIIRDIQDITGYGIPVISRATNGKYVQTPYGIYSLKHFFNERINNDEETSSHEIVSVIKEIIDSEPPEKPYSDQKIQEILKQRGYNIARRTVFKYRENRLHIPSSSKRRRSRL